VTVFDAVTERLGSTDFETFPAAMQPFVDKLDKTELVQMIKRKFDYIDSFGTLRWHARKFHHIVVDVIAVNVQSQRERAVP
jgi:hypothetical protein